MDSNTKIIIVDDHALFREGMKLLIEMEELGEVIAEAENGQEFIDLLDILNPDLVLMDIKMPVMSGLEATQKAIAKRPALKILVLTMTSWKENYSAIINSGAMGLVLKSSGKHLIEKAIKTLIGGECYFSDELL
jgi:DNA-binding NarL/FixJ family response regulator